MLFSVTLSLPWFSVISKTSLCVSGCACVCVFVCETLFLPGRGCVDTAIWMHYMDANKTAGEKTRRKLHKNVESRIEQVLATTPHETPTIRTLAPPSQKLYKLDEPDTRDTAGEARTSS